LPQDRSTIWRAATAALVVVTALLAWPLVQRYREQPPPPPPTFRLTFDPPPGVDLGAAQDGLDAAISPDEQELAFVATRDGRTALWRQRVDTGRAEPVPGTEGARAPVWSADGRTLAWIAGGRLKSAARDRGTSRDLGAAQDTRGLAALDDGALIFAASPDGALTRLHDGKTSAATVLQPGDRSHAWPARAPNGFVYVAVRDDGRRIMRLAASGATRDLGPTDAHAIVAGTWLLHVRGEALLAQRLADDGALAGRATAIVTGVGTANGRALVAASSRLLLAAAAPPQARHLSWIEADGTATPAADVGDYWQVRLSPDERTAAVTQLEPQLRTLDIYLLPLVPGAVASGLTLAMAADTDPVWASGSLVYFRSLQGGRPQLQKRDARRAGAPIDTVAAPAGNYLPTDVAPGGRMFLLQSASERGDTDLVLFDETGSAIRPVAASGFNESDGRWSPGGAWLAYVSDDFGQPDVFVQPWPSGQRVRVTSAGGSKPRWGADGRTLYFARDDEILRVALQPGAQLSVSAPTRAALVRGLRDFDVSRRSTRLLVIGAADSSPAPQVRALVDWQTLVPGP
jgi:hypothetical protein